jgi:hypothetical protein
MEMVYDVLHTWKSVEENRWILKMEKIVIENLIWESVKKKNLIFVLDTHPYVSEQAIFEQLKDGFVIVSDINNADFSFSAYDMGGQIMRKELKNITGGSTNIKIGPINFWVWTQNLGWYRNREPLNSKSYWKFHLKCNFFVGFKILAMQSRLKIRITVIVGDITWWKRLRTGKNILEFLFLWKEMSQSVNPIKNSEMRSIHLKNVESIFFNSC